jgi:hypothetical protein
MEKVNHTLHRNKSIKNKKQWGGYVQAIKKIKLYLNVVNIGGLCLVSYVYMPLPHYSKKKLFEDR